MISLFLGPNKKQKLGSDARSASDILNFIEENQNIVQILQENTKNQGTPILLNYNIY